MNFSQRFGLFILIAITVAYIYFSYFNNNSFENFSKNEPPSTYNPLEKENTKKNETIKNTNTNSEKIVKIFILDNTGKLKAINRNCNPDIESSCFEYAIKELVSAPSKWEKAKGFTSEIPAGTKILSVRETPNSVMIDLSSNFESGGGAESTYTRIEQIIKTANANTSRPTYLYINGRQANVIGGEGIMIKQPLNERSFDE